MNNMVSKGRDNFSKKTIEAIAKRASFICSNPECRCLTLCPSDEDQKKYIYIGKVAHITGAAKGGPRYDSSLSKEQRGSIENGIFICSNCAEMVDKNEGIDFPEVTLREWKKDHEEWISQNLNKSRKSLINPSAKPGITKGRVALPIKSAHGRYPHGNILLTNSGERVCYVEDLKLVCQEIEIDFEINIVSYDERRIRGHDPRGIELPLPVQPYEKRRVYFKAKEVEQYHGELPDEVKLKVRFDCSKEFFSETLIKDRERAVYLSSKM